MAAAAASSAARTIGEFDASRPERRGFAVGEAQGTGLDAQSSERRQHGAESERLVVRVSTHGEHRPKRELLAEMRRSCQAVPRAAAMGRVSR